jgi:hypothetical protein
LTKVNQGNSGWQAGTQAGTAAAVDCWSCGAVARPSTNLGGSGASVARGRFFWGILLLGRLCNGSFCGFLSAHRNKNRNGRGDGGGSDGLNLDPLLIALLKKIPEAEGLASAAALALVSNVRNERLANL